MNIEIQDAALEARMHRQMEATGVANAEEVLMRLLDTQEEQDRYWKTRARSIKRSGGGWLNSNAGRVFLKIN